MFQVNNTYRNNRARGQLVKTHNAWMDGNVYEGMSGPAVQADPDGCYWFESTPVFNWTLQGSVITDVNYGPGRQGSDVYLRLAARQCVTGCKSVSHPRWLHVRSCRCRCCACHMQTVQQALPWYQWMNVDRCLAVAKRVL